MDIGRRPGLLVHYEVRKMRPHFGPDVMDVLRTR
jgi:hypothetical protein